MFHIVVVENVRYFVIMSQAIILTLFGEEYVPEPVKGKKVRSTTKKEEETEYSEPDNNSENDTVAAEEQKTHKRSAKKRSNVNSTTILSGWRPEKQYYTIGEVANLFKVNTSHIRFWTNEFNLKVRTTRKGDRLYTPGQIEEINIIYRLVRKEGFTLARAKAKLKEEKKKQEDRKNMLESLSNLKTHLVTLREQLG